MKIRNTPVTQLSPNYKPKKKFLSCLNLQFFADSKLRIKANKMNNLPIFKLNYLNNKSSTTNVYCSYYSPFGKNNHQTDQIFIHEDSIHLNKILFAIWKQKNKDDPKLWFLAWKRCQAKKSLVKMLKHTNLLSTAKVSKKNKIRIIPI